MNKTQSADGIGTKKTGTDESSNYASDIKKDTSKSESGKAKTLEDLFEKGLKAMYSGEKQLIEALPQMAKAADSEELQDAIEGHLEETKRHAERLEKILDRLQVSKNETEKCEVMEKLIDAGKKMIDGTEAGPVRDSAIIIAAQKVEHHEIAAYSSLRELADVLGHSKIMDTLERTLQEEENADEKLTSIAQDVNDEAVEMSGKNGHKSSAKKEENNYSLHN